MSENPQSKTIYLRLATEDDAEFIHSLRLNENYNKYLSTVSGTAENQKSWLKNYKDRESRGEEYYFIIIRKDNDTAIGTVRLYDFIQDKNSFCWGSWILNENKTNSAAVESAILVYQFAFEKLNFTASHFDVRKENKRVIAFHEKMGAVKTHENDLDAFFSYTKESWLEKMKIFKRYLVK